MAQINRLDVTMEKATKAGRVKGRSIFMAIPVARERVINGADDIVEIITAYTDYFNEWEDPLLECVEYWLDDGFITCVADGIILWA